MTTRKPRIKITEIHGFNVSDKGAGTVGVFTLALKAELEKRGFEVVIDADGGDYGRHLLLRANYFYWFGDTIERIASSLKPDPEFDYQYMVAHSNGCNYGMKALKKINNPDIGLIFLSAALNKDFKFKPAFKWLANFHTFKDKTVGVSRLMPLSSWGNSGQVGFIYTSDTVSNFNFTNNTTLHSDWSKDHSIQKPVMKAADIITEDIRK